MKFNNFTLVHHFLERSAESFPDKVALVHENIRATYSEINFKANLFADHLIEQGVSMGDRVVIILQNGLEYVVSYYGILKAGAIAVSLSTDLKPEGLKPLLKEVNPKVIVSSSRFEKVLIESELEEFKILSLVLKEIKLEWPDAYSVYSWDDLIDDKESNNPDLLIEESSLASIIYTSGSTGKPKGVMLSHSNIIANTKSICQYLELTDKDIQMVVLPFFYVMGKSLLNTHFAIGGTVVINNKFAYPATVIKQLIEENITGFSGVPSTYAYLLHRSPLKNSRDKLVSLRYCSQAGGHMSKQVKEELKKALPDHTKIVIMYGATEASARLSYLEPYMFEDKIDSIGKAIPDVELKVLDENGHEVPVGETGELTGAGQNIMQGYWHDEEATNKVLDQNGYHTGDLAYKDDEGFFFLVGRKDNLLKVGGHRINPQEIEDILMESGLVIEAAVLGVPDELLGHKLIGIAAPIEKDCTENTILGYCSEMLPKYKVPGSIKLVRSLPKNPSGKIDRAKCVDIVN